MSETQEELQRELSEKDKELMIKGIRPDWMNKNMFRFYRKQLNYTVKSYLKGKFIYVSKEYATETDSETKEKRTVIKTYAPYDKKTVRN